MSIIFNTGVYGWQAPYGLRHFYPEDLPKSWQLDYYSNQFNTVMVPALPLNKLLSLKPQNWCDAVDDDFQFLLALDSTWFASNQLQTIQKILSALKPNLAAAVLPSSLASELVPPQHLLQLLKSHNTPLIDLSQSSDKLTILEDDLLDLKAVRQKIEQLHAHLSAQQALHQGASKQQAVQHLLIVKHPNLGAESLNNFNLMLEIMGF